MAYNIKDLSAGVLFIVLGAVFAFLTMNDLTIGTALRMGPGYFPLLLSGILIILGGVNVVAAFYNEPTHFEPLPWRGLFFILSAPLVFAFTVRGLGFAPAIILAAFLSSLASKQMSPLNILVLVVSITIFCLIVFYWGLGLPVRLIGPWLGTW